MGHKVHPTIFRIGGIINWKSRWFNKKQYQNFLKQDVELRDFIMRKIGKAGIDSIIIERSANMVNINIKTARPGLIIGRGGAGIEELKKEIVALLGKKRIKKVLEIKLDIEEIRQPESRANILATWMAEQIERRVPYRRILKQALDKATQFKEVQGIKVMIKGRLGGSEIARKEWLAKGRIPLQTLRANIDYAQTTAYTTYGTVGIKVWIYKGETFADKSKLK